MWYMTTCMYQKRSVVVLVSILEQYLKGGILRIKYFDIPLLVIIAYSEFGRGTLRHPASLPRIPNVTQVAIMTTVITSKHFPLLKMTSATSLLGPQKQQP